MNTLARSLLDHPPAVLRVIAELNGVTLRSNLAHQAVEQLVSMIAREDHLLHLLAGCSDQARQAIDALLRSQGHLPVPIFERRFGVIRSVGPGRLLREAPYRQPVSAAEELWYRGLIYRAFAERSHGLSEFIYVPSDLVPHLPQPEPLATSFILPDAGPPARAIVADDSLLHDACTLLCLAQAGGIRLAGLGSPFAWRTKSLYELNRFLLHPLQEPMTLSDSDPGSQAALMITLAQDLDWLRAGDRGILARVNVAKARPWLEASREEQRRQLLAAWETSSRWNDLCRAAALRCEETGNWSNDPRVTRRSLKPLVAALPPATWFRLDDLVAAIRRELPDFQRPDGDYDTWYIRRRNTQEFLRGYECWEDVEGEVLGSLVRGVLHWLGAVDLGAGEHSSEGSATLFRLTAAGAAWLKGLPVPQGTPAVPISVGSDFLVAVPESAALLTRFQVSRFTASESGGPPFVYRITQSGLHRAGRQGITSTQVLDFLMALTNGEVPENVANALRRWQPGSDKRER